MMKKRRGGVRTRTGNAQQMVQDGIVLKSENKQNTSLSIGWKWAQHKDAEWMFYDLITSEESGMIWGLKKTDL